MESREKLHMGKSRVNVIMTLPHLERKKALCCYRKHCT